MFPKATAYVRVSTNSKEQAHSLDFQIDYWKKYFVECPFYEFVGIYADKGISGKSVTNRPEFRRMINDALAFDVLDKDIEKKRGLDVILSSNKTKFI